jgi:hypothetical protein
MRPLLSRQSNLWLYPLYATVGGGFGYWLQGIELRQEKILKDRKEMLLDKRRRKAERESAKAELSSQDEAIIAGS